MSEFTDRFEEFIETPEYGENFRPSAWDIALPFEEEFKRHEDEGNPLLRHHVKSAVAQDTYKGLIYTLVWGYPNGNTDAKSQNKSYSLQKAMLDLDETVDRIDRFKNHPRKARIMIDTLNNHHGFQVSTTSKIAYFAGLKAPEGNCLIFDSQVCRAVLFYGYPELDDLRSRLAGGRLPGPYTKNEFKPLLKPANYGGWIEGVNALARLLGPYVEAEDVERFIFMLGKGADRATDESKAQTVSGKAASPLVETKPEKQPYMGKMTRNKKIKNELKAK
ncbi:hypothetical protein U1701_00045 [Sphingomonas sp. PB2P19]|uniref:8-oxoguanine DNA glycosylase OGG fold protein n=1 Tax=Sphingomonas rhamnosi TaxID=3096156 RepID=UPI002FC93134